MKPDSDIDRIGLEDGWEILIGRSASANDRLTLKVAHPNDFWFHVAGMPGSHVVARHPDHPVQCSRDVKRRAAAYAAHYSKARHAGKVAVHWTQCRHVGKRRGAPPGQVTLKRYDVIRVEPMAPNEPSGETP